MPKGVVTHPRNESLEPANQHAESKGLVDFAFAPEDVRAMALTLVINMTKNVSLTQPQPQPPKTNGSAAQWNQ